MLWQHYQDTKVNDELLIDMQVMQLDDDNDAQLAHPQVIFLNPLYDHCYHVSFFFSMF